jgi:Lamin Tail Domain
MRTFFTFLFLSFLVTNIKAQVVIQEIFGGAGGGTSPWNREVVIIKNYGTGSVDISNWAIQYNAANGTGSWSLAAIPGTVILSPGQSYRFCLSSVQTGASAPTCDGQSATNVPMAGTSARIALTSDEILLPTGASSCPAISGSVVDFVPYGTATNCTPETPNASSTTSVVRPNASATPDQWTVNSSPLPVELFGLSIFKVDKYSMIHFSTASETNNSHFNIERSADAGNFDTIGEIKGAGNSHSEITYTYTDENPLPGINYYRIKQTDYDGKFAYTGIKSVRHTSAGNLSITPRTTEGRLQVTTDIENYAIYVYNVSSQRVKSFRSLSFDQLISIDDLTAGLYYIKVNFGGQVETVKVVKI